MLFLVLALVGVAAAWWLWPATLAGPLAGLGAGAMLLAAPRSPANRSRSQRTCHSVALALVSLAFLAHALDRHSELAGAAAGLTLGSRLGEAASSPPSRPSR